MKSILDFIINTVLISIPEESFAVAFVLIFLGKSDMINLKKANLFRFSIPVLTTALITGFLRVVLRYGLDFMPFLAILLIFVTVLLVYKIRGFKKIMQCLALSIIGMVIPGLLQVAYVPVSMTIMRITIEEINKVNFGIICFTIPERVFEILIISYLLCKKKNIMRINPFRIIINNKSILSVFFTSLVLNMIFVYVFIYEIYVQRIIANLPVLSQLLCVMLVITLPVINMASIVGIIYVLAFREKSKRVYIMEETKAISALISVLSRRGNYSQIQNELKDFNRQMKEMESSIK